MKNYILKDATLNKSEIQRVYKYPRYPRGLKKHSDKGFINFESGSQGGTLWC